MKIVKIRFCKACHDDLMENGHFLFEYYMKLCGHYCEGIKIHVRGGSEGKGDTLTHYLENKGYIISTESSETTLMLMPIGHKLIENEIHEFCCKRREHGND